MSVSAKALGALPRALPAEASASSQQDIVLLVVCVLEAGETCLPVGSPVKFGGRAGEVF